MSLEITGKNLNISDLHAVARKGLEVTLSKKSKAGLWGLKKKPWTFSKKTPKQI